MNHYLKEVFNALYEKGYGLKKRKEDSFFVITENNSKYEVYDNGNDCICIGNYTNSFNYQDEYYLELILNHVSFLK